jgi:hypothetical protein
MLIVYLGSGERKDIPKAVTATIRGDKLVCLGVNKRPVALFPITQVHLCSDTATPAVPD